MTVAPIEIRVRAKYRMGPGKWPKSQKSRSNNNNKARHKIPNKNQVQGEPRVLLMADAYRGSTIIVTETEARKRLLDKMLGR